MSYKNDDEKIIASRINGLLADTHTSQVQYAAILSMSQPTISAKLSGATRFTAKDIWRTALAFNVSTDYLYGLTDARTRGTCEREKAYGTCIGHFQARGRIAVRIRAVDETHPTFPKT